jgi:FkbM family methyltransferase
MQDLDFIEIGTSNFDTLLEKCSSKEYGISIEPLKTYLDDLPEKPNVKKINCAVTHGKITDFIDIYYIPKPQIVTHKLQEWFKGCNTIGNYHPLHIKHKVQHLVQIDKVPLVNISDLLQKENVRKIKYLKIDTEGHDVVILKGLYDYLTTKEKEYYPEKIKFESNEHTAFEKVTEIINLFLKLGYKLVSRGYDTYLSLN